MGKERRRIERRASVASSLQFSKIQSLHKAGTEMLAAASPRHYRENISNSKFKIFGD
jgi:hypothetical protein